MKVVIAGSRGTRDYQVVKDIVEESPFDITEVVSGGARGVDSLGERWAEYHDVPTTGDRFHISSEEWDEMGSKAGPLRNADMAEYADAAIAIWDGQSPGTRSMIEKAYEEGIPVEITLTTEPPENDLGKDEILRRLPEIDRLRDGFYKPMLLEAAKGYPEYFWQLPTSSTGKYHPHDECGQHGNWLHTKRMYATYEHLSRSLVEEGVITEDDREAGKAAALLHDMYKYGYPEAEGEYTVSYHDVLGAAYVRQYTELPEKVARLIETHNGAWHCGPTPRNPHERLFHAADMAAAQRGTNTAIVKPAEELEEISDRLIVKDEEE